MVYYVAPPFYKVLVDADNIVFDLAPAIFGGKAHTICMSNSREKDHRGEGVALIVG